MKLPKFSTPVFEIILFAPLVGLLCVGNLFAATEPDQILCYKQASGTNLNLLILQPKTGAATRPGLLYSAGHQVVLEDDWRIQASDQAHATGAEISSAAFDTTKWYPAAVPETVLSALVKAGVYRDIFVGTNLAKVPTEPFRGSWWYRKTFAWSSGSGSNAELVFDGINYRANVWLNGIPISSTNELFGAFRIFRLDVTGRLKSGNNVLAVEVFPPRAGDFSVGFVDWNPPPPDRNLGLFRPVEIHSCQGVGIEHPFVESKLSHQNWKAAELTIHADLVNHANEAVATMVKVEIAGITFNANIRLAARESRAVAFTSGQHPELKLKAPRLWWPWELGEPWLHSLKITTIVAGETTDQEEIRFGIREVADYLSPEGHRGYLVNGRKILIRGGGWADDLLLDEDPAKLEAQIQYTRAMNLNTIRLEGVWGSSQRLYDLADKYGLLLMCGWSCQWEWKDYLGKKCDQFGGFKSVEDLNLAVNYLRDQVLWLRQHPSIFVWVLGSDMLPRPELEQRYADLLATIDSTRPTLKACGGKTSKISGPTGVKMSGPYEYVTPNYWYLDKKNGGAFGFNTETGPGPQPPPFESLQRMLPANDLWPVGPDWNFHCGRNEFNTIHRYLNAFNVRYGPAKDAAEFAFRSQAANYEAIRPMFESFAANLPRTTGIVQWMLNASWPKLFWQLYDYHLLPGGAFFGAKKGAAPLAILYSYADRGIYLVNQTAPVAGDLRASVEVIDADSKIILRTNSMIQCPAYGPAKICDLADLSSPTPVFFVALELGNSSGKSLADNFYWLSTKPDVLDEEKTDWFVTPNKSYADFTALNQLPPAEVQASMNVTNTPDGTDAAVTVKNSGPTLAFFIELRLTDRSSGQTILPVLWSDNYISLPPGGEKTCRAHLPAVVAETKPELRLRGWNVKPQIIK